MKKCLLIIATSVFLFFGRAIGQTSKPVFFEYGFGVDFSLGRNLFATKNAFANPSTTVEYQSHGIYNHPSLKFRASMMREIGDVFFLGLQLGLDCHFGEERSGAHYHFINIPIQAKIQKAFFKSRYAEISGNLLGGVNVFEVRDDYSTIRGGSIFGLSATLTKRRLFYEVGISIQKDHVNATYYNPFFGSGQNAFRTVRTSLNREQLFLIIGKRR